MRTLILKNFIDFLNTQLLAVMDTSFYIALFKKIRFIQKFDKIFVHKPKKRNKNKIICLPLTLS